jgi:phage shock protein PspC (stress-responsive transcriptional regulator)
MTAPVPSPRLRRTRTNAVLGGVCAGIARSAGLDPLLLRIAVVAVTVLTGGAGLLAYLAAWVLIPREAAPDVLPPGADRPGPPLAAATGSTAQSSGSGAGSADVRTAWTAAGNDLRSLAAELRRPAACPTSTTSATGTTGTGMPHTSGARGADPVDIAEEITPDPAAPAGAVPSPRSPLTAADDAATALGERLRTPEVQEGARRAAASVTQAVTASVDELGRRIRRDPS